MRNKIGQCLVQAGLVVPTRIKQWTFYRRDEERVREVKKAVQGSL